MGGFDVVVTGFRLNAREPAPKALSRVLGLSLEEAKACAKRFPYVALADVPAAQAEALRATLEEAGARVSVEEHTLSPEQSASVLIPAPALDAPPANGVAASSQLAPPALVEPASTVAFKPRRPVTLPELELSLATEPVAMGLEEVASGMLLHTERDLQREIALPPQAPELVADDGFLSLPESEPARSLPADVVGGERELSEARDASSENAAELAPPPLFQSASLELSAQLEALRPVLAPLPLYESLAPLPSPVQGVAAVQAPNVSSRPSEARELSPYALGDILVDLSPAPKGSATAPKVAVAPPPPATVNDFDSVPPESAALELDYSKGVRENTAPSGKRDLTSPKKNDVTESFGMGAGRDLDDSLNPEVSMPAPEIEVVAPTTTVTKNSSERTGDLWLVASPKDSANAARVLAQVTGLPLDRAMRLVQTAPCLIASGWKLSKIKSAGSPLIAAGFELKVRAS